jgi:HPt (histidine-containing phosphotransfer) domain-containing protein
MENTELIESIGLPNLAELAKGDLVFVNKLLETYIRNAKSELDLMIVAKDKMDLDQIVHIAHKLRSSFVLFEFEELLALSIYLEKKPDSPNELERFLSGMKNKMAFIIEAKKKLDQY